MQPLAAADHDQIGAHLAVAREPVRRRQLARRIDQHRHTGFAGDVDQLLRRHHGRLRLALDHAEHGDHRGPVGDGIDELVARLDIDDRHAGRAVRAIVGEAVRLLHEALALRPGGMRQRNGNVFGSEEN